MPVFCEYLYFLNAWILGIPVKYYYNYYFRYLKWTLIHCYSITNKNSRFWLMSISISLQSTIIFHRLFPIKAFMCQFQLLNQEGWIEVMHSTMYYANNRVAVVLIAAYFILTHLSMIAVRRYSMCVMWHAKVMTNANCAHMLICIDFIMLKCISKQFK